MKKLKISIIWIVCSVMLFGLGYWQAQRAAQSEAWSNRVQLPAIIHPIWELTPLYYRVHLPKQEVSSSLFEKNHLKKIPILHAISIHPADHWTDLNGWKVPLPYQIPQFKRSHHQFLSQSSYGLSVKMPVFLSPKRHIAYAIQWTILGCIALGMGFRNCISNPSNIR